MIAVLLHHAPVYAFGIQKNLQNWNMYVKIFRGKGAGVVAPSRPLPRQTISAFSHSLLSSFS